MASMKQKNKAAKKARPAGAPHPDGDRRRRGGPDCNQATRDKRLRQTFAGGIPIDDPPPAGP
jgi:hypothetical protein